MGHPLSPAIFSHTFTIQILLQGYCKQLDNLPCVFLLQLEIIPGDVLYPES